MLSYSTIINKYPLTESETLRNEISQLLEKNRIKIIILDDDPTGIQTVHGCLLITQWDEQTISLAMADNAPFFYVLTNSRSLNQKDAENINRTVVRNAISANKKYFFKLIFISRSDSTLRGHFPLEPDTIRSEALLCGLKAELPTFFIPSFLEVGRFTIDNIHYLKDGDQLIPVAETEFAHDNVFGYSQSDLTEYIIEKTKENILRDSIVSISIDDLRKNPVNTICDKINQVRQAKYIIVNALDYYDLRKFALSLLNLFTDAENCLVIRTSSSLPKAISGIQDKPLLTGTDLLTKNGAGIFMVGSHVKKTTLQLEKLLLHKNTKGVEINILEILDNPELTLNKTVDNIKSVVNSGLTPVLYTSREEIRTNDKNERLETGKKISAFIVNIVKNLPFNPSFIVAKGGITSNDILTKGLSVQKARVMGQISTGVPVIRTDNTNHFQNLPYIIFPGNVGDENSLVDILEKLALQYP